MGATMGPMFATRVQATATRMDALARAARRPGLSLRRSYRIWSDHCGDWEAERTRLLTASRRYGGTRAGPAIDPDRSQSPQAVPRWWAALLQGRCEPVERTRQRVNVGHAAGHFSWAEGFTWLLLIALEADS